MTTNEPTMTSKVETFKNLDGQTVHAVFVPAVTTEGHSIMRHCGTFESRQQAEQRISDHAAGRLPSWDEPE